jgi:uncharacterized protein YcnI
MRRVSVLVCLLVVVVTGILAGTRGAFAHVEFDPPEAAPGSVVELVLELENERSDAATVRVELRFWPEDLRLTVVAIAATGGWTASVDGGRLGAPARGITWTRPSGSPSEHPRLAFTIGPLPDREGPLEFKVVQTYSSGDVDRWIQETPPGAPAAEFPAPVLQLRRGAPGSIPPATTAASTSTTATTSTTAAVPAPPTTARAAGGQDDGGGAGAAVPITVAAIAAAAVAAGAAWYRRRRAA